MKNEIKKDLPIYTTDILTISIKTIGDVADLLTAYYDKEAVRLLKSIKIRVMMMNLTTTLLLKK